MAVILIGTSGWSYSKGEGAWNGTFYPAQVKTGQLSFFSQFFQTVEINTSFYRPLEQSMAQKWVRETPPHFRFSVKLWQKFTHPRMYREATGEEAEVSVDDVTLFKKGMEPIVKAGRLVALLAQFPASFTSSAQNWAILRAVVHHFGEYPLAIELRHKSWSDDTGTVEWFLQHNIAWVQIDEPQFGSSVVCQNTPTAHLAYFRFHGRNKETWWSGDNESRYKYLYSTEELKELIYRVQRAAETADTVVAYFNNHWRGWAPRNAIEMKKELGQSYVDVPQGDPRSGLL